MRNLISSSNLVFAATAAFTCVLGILVVTPRPILEQDAACYVQMAEGSWHLVPPPYRYRVFTPAIAYALPLPAKTGIRTINYAALAFCYFLALLLLREMGISLAASVFAVLSLLCARAHLYDYYDPYLTDPLALVTIFGMFISYVQSRPVLFGISGALGVLMRESPCFVIPSWLFRREWKAGLLIAGFSGVLFVLPRVLMPQWHWQPSSCIPPASEMGSTYAGYMWWSTTSVLVQTLHSPMRWLRAVFFSFGVLWPLSIAGLLLLAKQKLRAVRVPSVLLVLGVAASSLIAIDNERMLAVLAPVMVIGVGRMFDCCRGNAKASALFAVALTFQLILGSPYILYRSWYATGLMVATGLSFGLALMGFYLLRQKLRTAPELPG